MPRWKQQIGGLVMVLIGAGFTAWGWYTALYRGVRKKGQKAGLGAEGGQTANRCAENQKLDR